MVLTLLDLLVSLTYFPAPSTSAIAMSHFVEETTEKFEMSEDSSVSSIKVLFLFPLRILRGVGLPGEPTGVIFNLAKNNKK